tara:strand:+ start:466 stop:657 length:192 start_codon:yes stop_codon:yes gene_type:complete
MSKKKDLQKMVKIQKATIKILNANLEAYDKKVKKLEKENQSLRVRLNETNGFNFMRNVWDKDE